VILRNLKNQLNQILLLNKDFEEILLKHGGTYNPNFGVEGGFEFEHKRKKSTWLMLLDNITGKNKTQKGKIPCLINLDFQDMISQLKQSKGKF